MLYARTRARSRPPQNFSAGKIFWKNSGKPVDNTKLVCYIGIVKRLGGQLHRAEAR